MSSMQVNMRGQNPSSQLNAAVRGGARPRTVKKTAGQKFGSLVKGVVNVAAGVAGAAIPGASVLGNAFGKIAGGFGQSVSSAGGILGGGSTFGNMSGGGGSMVSEMMQANMEFLALQNAIQMESRKFSTLSNASKAKHEMNMNTIRNLK